MGNKREVIYRMSRVRPEVEGQDMDSVASSRARGDRRAFDILMEAQGYWDSMEQFRKDRAQQAILLRGPMARPDNSGWVPDERRGIYSATRECAAEEQPDKATCS